MVFSFKKMYAYGICSHMDFPNPMPIPVLYPKHTGMGPNIYKYLYVVKKNHTSIGSHTSVVMPVRIRGYFVYG